ncbi:MAG TPA: signal peptide peptidase SppA [Rhizomicrobium sp.]|jgi:protease-4
MVAFLHWAKSVALGTLNGLVKIALAIVLVVLVLVVIGMIRGDGLPDKMVLTADLRTSMPDSSRRAGLAFAERPLTTMGMVLTLDRASRDSRVKGLFLRMGGGVSIAQAEELDAAIKRFRQSGRFVVVHSQGFDSGGIGDYLAAASANEVWMQPKSMFGAAGTGAGALFLRGLFDKINAVPQIAKRSDYKSAADMFMEKDYTAPDRVQTTAFLQSWYDSATQGAGVLRNVPAKQVAGFFQDDPQFAEDALREHLIDRIGYDDDAKDAALGRAGSGARPVALKHYETEIGDLGEAGLPHVALIEAAGDIVDGGTHDGVDGSSVIAGDDYARAIRQATRDRDVKAIVLRVDSPGGSVSASDQILDALKKAQKAGKPVVVSMATLAASGGYYISASADRIVAEPATLTGSIGVLTGKVSFGKSVQMIGVTVDQIGIGKNALMDSVASPYTPDQWANLNHQADVIYVDFTQKVAEGRKMPLAKVQDIAKGRVWTGADAKSRGLVDQLGGFWTAVDDAKKLAGISANERVAFKIYPKRVGLFEALSSTFSGTAAGMRAVEGLAAIEQLPVAHAVLGALTDSARGGVQMKAEGLPVR